MPQFFIKGLLRFLTRREYDLKTAEVHEKLNLLKLKELACKPGSVENSHSSRL